MRSLILGSFPSAVAIRHHSLTCIVGLVFEVFGSMDAKQADVGKATPACGGRIDPAHLRWPGGDPKIPLPVFNCAPRLAA